MITQNESFFSNCGSVFGLDARLPLRLQKRQLLNALGFPGNNKLIPCRADDDQKVASLSESYVSLGFPFLILVSEKPSTTSVPPLFFVESLTDVVWRDKTDRRRTITFDDALRVIKDYPTGTWLEFSDYLWGPATLAGRLAYIDASEQIIELQAGVIPRQLLLRDKRQLSVFSASINFFEVSRNCYSETGQTLRTLGHENILPFSVVQRVARSLGHNACGFVKLAKIAPMPTLEFAFMPSQSFVCIDIDWPSQWKEARHETIGNFNASR